MNDAATRLTALAERIELWPVERLRPYERNSRTHSEDQVAQLAASMVEFSFTNPILVDETNGILAGHGRLMAARRLRLGPRLLTCGSRASGHDTACADHLGRTRAR